MVAIYLHFTVVYTNAQPSLDYFPNMFSFSPSFALKKHGCFNVEITHSCLVLWGCLSLLSIPSHSTTLRISLLFSFSSSLPTERGYWDGFGSYVILGYFLKKPCELFCTGMNGMTIGTTGEAGSHVRTGAEGWGRLEAYAQNSFLRPSLLKLAQGTNEEP